MTKIRALTDCTVVFWCDPTLSSCLCFSDKVEQVSPSVPHQSMGQTPTPRSTQWGGNQHKSCLLSTSQCDTINTFPPLLPTMNSSTIGSFYRHMFGNVLKLFRRDGGFFSPYTHLGEDQQCEIVNMCKLIPANDLDKDQSWEWGQTLTQSAWKSNV